MYRNQDEPPFLSHPGSDAEARAAALGALLDGLCGSRVAEIDFADGALSLTGRDAELAPAWRIVVRGSARFTFSHRSGDRRWLVEANFDAGGKLRNSDRAMILATTGAVIESFHIDGEGLFLRSDDGRAIEIVHAVSGGAEVVLEIGAGADATRIVLPDEMERWGIDPEAY